MARLRRPPAASGMVLVLIAVSFIVFVIFIVVPGGDPAQRIAGKNATQQNIENIRHDWGFDQPFYVQYYDMMKKAFSGQSRLVHEPDERRRARSSRACPATFSLAIGAGIIWLFCGHRRGGDLGRQRRASWSDRVVTVLALVGISMPVFWLGIIVRYYLAEGGITTFFPDGGYVPLTQDPVAVVLAPGPAVDRARGAVHRLLRPRAALEHPRHDQRGLRAHRARQGHRPARA